MALESPFCRVSTVMHKEGGKHLGPVQCAKKFRMVAKLHEVIRRRCSGAGETIWRFMEGFDDESTECPIIAFQDGRLIKHDPAVIVWLKILQHLIVCDCDLRTDRSAGI